MPVSGFCSGLLAGRPNHLNGHAHTGSAGAPVALGLSATALTPTARDEHHQVTSPTIPLQHRAAPKCHRSPPPPPPPSASPTSSSRRSPRRPSSSSSSTAAQTPARALLHRRLLYLRRGLPYPSVLWSRVPTLPALPTSPHPGLRAGALDRLLRVAAPPARHRPLHAVPGWQLLAVADEATPPTAGPTRAPPCSRSPDQARLGFRSVAFLPARGPARKAVGYLFALQRGARAIYDADARSAVVGGNLSRRFDVDLEQQRQGGEVLLQYSHADANRTAVNPYVHFGQPSVWPRGLPLEKAGEVGNEEFYTEVFGGGQFIQQGLCNGLPDVDAVFYFTRKTSEMDPFDFRF
ncbi:hypothetical protein PR202_gn00744 [Eleusine coracana subsp. coracana]|uniref:Uncharacterized protein n=1 Tax=Eleusine coracana subsp. coracana TaxID=191504 RepID=A0AAV5G406_ELECO|nr:hypothetical protein PR202_gn00744 [Eleusine coracana subsp. coracana]